MDIQAIHDGNMTPITIRSLLAADLPRIADLDRSEVIRVGYETHGGKLVGSDVEWDVPNFIQQGSGEHTLAEQISFCRRHFEASAEAIGAFDGDKLVGIGLITPEIRPGLAQLAYLQVSSAYRRRGIGRQIVEGLLSRAQAWGAKQVYVSATPSQSAVEFYLSFGFRVAPDPLPDLYALEPEDIHMLVDLPDGLGQGPPGRTREDEP